MKTLKISALLTILLICNYAQANELNDMVSTRIQQLQIQIEKIDLEIKNNANITEEEFAELVAAEDQLKELSQFYKNKLEEVKK